MQLHFSVLGPAIVEQYERCVSFVVQRPGLRFSHSWARGAHQEALASVGYNFGTDMDREIATLKAELAKL